LRPRLRGAAPRQRAAAAPPPPQRRAPHASGALWADKHAPTGDAELAVAKKARRARAVPPPHALESNSKPPLARTLAQNDASVSLSLSLFSRAQKLDAVRGWLALQASAGGGVRGGRALVLSGPAGAGKSAAARVLAAAAGFSIVEWAPPVPTLWEEHRHHGGGGGGGEYVSKARACACAHSARHSQSDCPSIRLLPRALSCS
jgi:hypothetical protein